MDFKNIKETFRKNGYMVIKNLLSPEAVNFYKKELIDLSKGKKQRWTQGDGVSNKSVFWPIIFNKKLLEVSKAILGENIKYLQHNDLHVGFSSFAWHRDSINRKFGVGPDWDETEEPYRLLRAGIYLQEANSNFKLGLIKGSHRPDLLMDEVEAAFMEKQISGVKSLLSKMTGKDLLSSQADWIATNPGDCILFDPRIVHTGSKFEGVKYSVFVAYGIPNKHFFNHYHYYRHLREDLPYQELPAELVEQLREHNLYAPQTRPLNKKIEGAWIPSSTFSFVAKQFK